MFCVELLCCRLQIGVVLVLSKSFEQRFVFATVIGVFVLTRSRVASMLIVVRI